MRNRALCITRNVIPYVKELRNLAGSVTASILMQQLDYWFDRSPDGFWKFLEPSFHKMYKQGDSWTEELGFSAKEFWTAFKQIGIAYKSKTQFENAVDKFQGRFYASYYDRKQGLTFYFRNHLLVDRQLDELMRMPTPQRAKALREGNKVSKSRNDDRSVTEVTNRQLDIYRDYSDNLLYSGSPQASESTVEEVEPVRALPGSADRAIEKEKAQLKVRVKGLLNQKTLSRNIAKMIDELDVAAVEDAIETLELKKQEGLDKPKWAAYFVGILKRKIDPNLNQKPLTQTQLKKMHKERQKYASYEINEASPPIRIKRGTEWLNVAFGGFYYDEFYDDYVVNYYLFKEFENKRYVNRDTFNQVKYSGVEVYPA